MTLRSDRFPIAVAIVMAILAAALSADARTAHAAGTPAQKHEVNSLTTQFPLGQQTLCCSSKPRRQATKPAPRPSKASQTTSVTSTAAAAPSPRSRTATASQTPLLGSHDGSAMGPLIAIAVVILGGAAAVLVGLLSARRRRRARRTARAGPATPGAPPAVSRADAAPRPDSVSRPDAPRTNSVPRADAAPRTDEAPPARPAPIEWRRTRSRARARAPLEPAPLEPAPIEPAPIEPAPIEPAPIEPDLQPSPAVAGPTDPGRAHRFSDAADEKLVADPLARLEREILEQGAAPAAPGSRQSAPGQGAYRLGQVLYKRGRLDEAAAAWRLAASKQHPEAVARLAELLEETGGTDARS